MIKKGIYFAIVTAIISGFAVFLASLAGKQVTDAYVLATGRNIIVAILFTSVLLGIWIFSRRHCEDSDNKVGRRGNLRDSSTPLRGVYTEYARSAQNDKGERDSSALLGMTRSLTTKQWLQLVLIGIIGGSIPFLLFFQGLSIAGAANGAFIQKSLFIWVGLLAVMFLKEKLGIWQWLALAVLLVGNYFLGGPKSWAFGYGELLVFIATLFWAVEIIIVKKVIKNLPAIIVAWGRMFFGSIIMLGFLAFTGRLEIYNILNLNQWFWIILPSLLLFAYVGFWYTSLKYAPASLVASILVIAAPITALLSSIFITHKYQLNQAVGIILIIIAIIIIIKFLPKINIKKRQLTRHDI